MSYSMHVETRGRRAPVRATGDQAAFAILYDRYERRVFGLDYRLTGSADEAADATQDAFVKLLEKLPRSGEPVRKFASYVPSASSSRNVKSVER